MVPATESMEEERMIRMSLMEDAGSLEREEQMIRELGDSQEKDITFDTRFLTIICC